MIVILHLLLHCNCRRYLKWNTSKSIAKLNVSLDSHSEILNQNNLRRLDTAPTSSHVSTLQINTNVKNNIRVCFAIKESAEVYYQTIFNEISYYFVDA